MIFLHQADDKLVALDAKTGKVAWTVANGDPSKGQTGTSSPLVVKDKVLVGTSGGEFGVACHLTAYDMKTGKQAWRAYSSGPDEQIMLDPVKTTELGKPVGKDSSIKTWQGDQWKIGGGCTWGWISYDPQLDLVYYGSGNPSTWNPKQRPGDNKWSMTIFARNPDTGMAKWVYQMTPHDEWDYDGINEMILADIPVGGATAAGRWCISTVTGLGYTHRPRRAVNCWWRRSSIRCVNWASGVDHGDGELAASTGVPRRSHSTRPKHGGEDVGDGGHLPIGARQPRTSNRRRSHRKRKLFYVPTNHVRAWSYEPFHGELTRPGSRTSERHADDVRRRQRLDATSRQLHRLGCRQRARSCGRCKERFSVWSGALATAGGVVFYGTLEGYLKAVDAKTGKELYKFKTPSGIIGNVNTYEHNGRQYIAILSGVGGWAGIGLAAGLTDPNAGLGAVGGYAALSNYTALGGQLTVFALPAGN